MTSQRVVRKSLGGEEDLLWGEGSVTQTRNGQDYTINKVRNAKPVNTLAELNALDPLQFPKARLYQDDTVIDYAYIGTEWKALECSPIATVAAMEAIAELPAGLTVRTLVNNTTSNAGGAEYLIKTAADYGGIPDGYGDHTLANGNIAVLNKTSGVIRSKQWGCVGDGITDDYSALQSLFDYAANNKNSVKYVSMDDGQYAHSQTLTLNIASISIIGDVYGFRQSGSTKSSVGFIYTGGIAPAWQCNKNLGTFAGFNVVNIGNATCWLELNSGAQNIIFDKIYALNVTGHVAYTEAVIKCNGARIGYSQFKNIVATDPAPAFLLIKDSSTTGATPITFNERCIFRGATLFTIVKVDNSSLEQISFRDNTFIQVDSELTVVDTTINPTANPLASLEIVNNEFDSDTGGTIAADRYFKLENTGNIRFDGNHVNAGGVLARNLFTLTNCSVASCKGNYMKSFGYVFDADDNTIIRGVGYNAADWSSMEGISNNPNCARTTLTQATVISIDGADWGPDEKAVFEVDLIDASAYTFALDLSRPQNWEPGQHFFIIIKNTSGGAVAAPLFSASTFDVQSTAFTAPAASKQTAIEFVFNGEEAQQVSQQGPDIPV